jgi:hypothetical protein
MAFVFVGTGLKIVTTISVEVEGRIKGGHLDGIGFGYGV